MRTAALLALLLACCGGLACYEWASPTPLPDERYTEWWAEMVACAGDGGLALEGIAWEIREEPEQVSRDRIRVGHWTPPNKIWIARGYHDDSDVVKHEMMHYRLDRGDHPAPPFGLCTEGL